MKILDVLTLILIVLKVFGLISIGWLTIFLVWFIPVIIGLSLVFIGVALSNYGDK